MKWDVFISHAREDKEAIARPLAKGLEEQGIKVWFDEFTLTVGDSLRRSIDQGLARSRFGIVLISKKVSAERVAAKGIGWLGFPRNRRRQGHITCLARNRRNRDSNPFTALSGSVGGVFGQGPSSLSDLMGGTITICVRIAELIRA
jgi:TIR domain